MLEEKEEVPLMSITKARYLGKCGTASTELKEKVHAMYIATVISIQISGAKSIVSHTCLAKLHKL